MPIKLRFICLCPDSLLFFTCLKKCYELTVILALEIKSHFFDDHSNQYSIELIGCQPLTAVIY